MFKPGDAVIALKHIRATNVESPEYGRVIPKGYIDIIITIRDQNAIGLQGDKDPGGWFWSTKNFRKLAEASELDTVLREIELAILN